MSFKARFRLYTCKLVFSDINFIVYQNVSFSSFSVPSWIYLISNYTIFTKYSIQNNKLPDMTVTAPINNFSLGATINNKSLSDKSIIAGDEKNKADMNCTMQPSGQTALHLAAHRGKQTCLDLLLAQADAQVNKHV